MINLAHCFSQYQLQFIDKTTSWRHTRVYKAHQQWKIIQFNSRTTNKHAFAGLYLFIKKDFLLLLFKIGISAEECKFITVTWCKEKAEKCWASPAVRPSIYSSTKSCQPWFAWALCYQTFISPLVTMSCSLTIWSSRLCQFGAYSASVMSAVLFKNIYTWASLVPGLHASDGILIFIQGVCALAMGRLHGMTHISKLSVSLVAMLL